MPPVGSLSLVVAARTASAALHLSFTPSSGERMDPRAFGDPLWLGAWTTLRLTGAALLLGFILGALACWMQLSGHRTLAVLSRGCVAAVRGVPDLLLILLVYFGGMQLLNWLLGRPVEVPPFAAATVALALPFGAAVSEVFRDALESIDGAQREAAAMLGMRPAIAFLRVVVPQALLPCGRQAIVLLKQTSLASVIGCGELMRQAADAAHVSGKPFTMYLAAASIYLLLMVLATLALEAVQRVNARHLEG
jgi:His/Glu/Gln/Arg/opine family amino acid ABC transporter permease subunit